MSSIDPPSFEINLDLPAEERFLEIYTHFADKIKPMFEKFFSFIPKSRQRFRFDVLAKYLEKIDNDYYKEVECLSKAIDFPIDKCMAVDHICEVTVGCCSIICKARDEQNGGYKMVHDVPLMREVLYKGIITKGGKEICTNLIFAGFQVYTSIKKEAFSISYNVRYKRQKDGFVKSMVFALLGYHKWAKIIRDTMINYDNFDDAVEYLKTIPSINECYLTVCGLDKGVKITRDRLHARLDWVFLDEGIFYDVQTNCDTWEDPPSRDKGRLKKARECVEKVGFEEMDEERMLFDVLTVSPVTNRETVYCSFMDPTSYQCSVVIPDNYSKI